MFKRGARARYVRIVLRAPTKLFKWRRSSRRDYDLVSDDEYDPRVPLHPDEAFQYGITFRAKYIGTMDVPRPSSRVEIVAAMRRVRYEFKAQSVRKRKVTLDVSTSGVRVTLRTNKRRKAKRFFSRKCKSDTACETVELLHHPIYRIFYVSHDSSDLTIFSYIARDGSTDDFKCNVFKSSKKSQAMKIVRTVGQAFEVCHKMQSSSPEEPEPSTSSALDPPKAPTYSRGSSESGAASGSGSGSGSKAGSGEPACGEKKGAPKHLDLQPLSEMEGKRTRVGAPGESTEPADAGAGMPSAPEDVDATIPFDARMLRVRLVLQAQHTRLALAQLQHVEQQLAAERAARLDAQARTHQLLLHNKELLEHIATLLSHLEKRENVDAGSISAHRLTLLPQRGETFETNGNRQRSEGELIDFTLFNNATVLDESAENNNAGTSPSGPTPGGDKPVSFDLTDEQLQNYLVDKFNSLTFLNGRVDPDDDGDRQFYQNSGAFPSIPPISVDSDLVRLSSGHVYENGAGSRDVPSASADALSIAQYQNSFFGVARESGSSFKGSTSSDSSSEDGLPYIMPLSHAVTLKATGEDGRVRLIVPVSPSGSASEVLRRGGQGPRTTSRPGGICERTSAAAITRTTSEKAPNRNELMAAIRAQWARHTTK